MYTFLLIEHTFSMLVRIQPRPPSESEQGSDAGRDAELVRHQMVNLTKDIKARLT